MCLGFVDCSGQEKATKQQAVLLVERDRFAFLYCLTLQNNVFLKVIIAYL